MKSTELHKLMKQNGWLVARQSGSHVIYEKGDKTIVVPFHGSKEIATGTANKILKAAGLK